MIFVCLDYTKGAYNTMELKEKLLNRLNSVEDNSKLWSIRRADIAKELGIGLSTIYFWWNNPTLERVRKIELAFNILQKKKQS